MKTESNANHGQPADASEKRYRTFEDLEVYQIAREFRKAMYRVNRQLPSFDKFELGSQIRRAAVSLTNNIAEGHGRFHYLEQLKFCLNARGSLEELIDDSQHLCRRIVSADRGNRYVKTAGLASSPGPRRLHALVAGAKTECCTQVARRFSSLRLDGSRTRRTAR
jgi:four helix bundle protein